MQAAIKKYHRHGGLYKQQKIISHSCGGWDAKMRVPAGSGYGESPHLGCRLPTSRCVLTWCKELESSDPMHEGPALRT